MSSAPKIRRYPAAPSTPDNLPLRVSSELASAKTAGALGSVATPEAIAGRKPLSGDLVDPAAVEKRRAEQRAAELKGYQDVLVRGTCRFGYQEGPASDPTKYSVGAQKIGEKDAPWVNITPLVAPGRQLIRTKRDTETGAITHQTWNITTIAPSKLETDVTRVQLNRVNEHGTLITGSIDLSQVMAREADGKKWTIPIPPA